MISEYASFSHNGLVIDVNFNEAVVPCKYIRFQLGGKEVVITREDLYAMMVLFADDKQMDDLIPVVETKVRAITRLLKVRAKKDMKKGEIMAFQYTYFMPLAIAEKLLLNNPREYSSALSTGIPDLGAVVNKKK